MSCASDHSYGTVLYKKVYFHFFTFRRPKGRTAVLQSALFMYVKCLWRMNYFTSKKTVLWCFSQISNKVWKNWREGSIKQIIECWYIEQERNWMFLVLLFYWIAYLKSLPTFSKKRDYKMSVLWRKTVKWYLYLLFSVCKTCWRHGLSVKSTCNSCSETRFNNKYPQYDLQPSLTSIPWEFKPFFWTSWGYCVHTGMEAKY